MFHTPEYWDWERNETVTVRLKGVFQYATKGFARGLALEIDDNIGERSPDMKALREELHCAFSEKDLKWVKSRN